LRSLHILERDEAVALRSARLRVHDYSGVRDRVGGILEGISEIVDADVGADVADEEGETVFGGFGWGGPVDSELGAVEVVALEFFEVVLG